MKSNINLFNIKFKNLLIYESPYIKTPFHKKIKIIFADTTASGRPSPFIEKFINTNILPYYSNTHSNAFCGTLMKKYVEKTKQFMREYLNINKSKKIIFTGSGTTCAINHLIFCLKLDSVGLNINIFISELEHHSNYLPWVELTKKNANIKLHIIPFGNNKNFDIDIDYIENMIKNTNEHTINIISLTACSNVLGIMIDIKKIYNILQKYNNIQCEYGKKNLLFVDYACCAPYIRINSELCDALYFSPHKYLGGISTPGVLIANSCLFHNSTPFTPGGGCVKNVCMGVIEYDTDIEKREMAGTPNIIGIIRIYFLLKLQNIILNYITHNEHEITHYVFNKFDEMRSMYKNLIVIFPNIKQYTNNRLPIVCFTIKDIHYNLIVKLLNDLYGIQSRGGVSCTGNLADIIKQKYNINGWCRITFNWLMTLEEINFIISSIENIIKNDIEVYSKYYKYNKSTNLFYYEQQLP